MSGNTRSATWTCEEKNLSLTSENNLKNNYHLNNQIDTVLYKIMGAFLERSQMIFTKHLITKNKKKIPNIYMIAETVSD